MSLGSCHSIADSTGLGISYFAQRLSLCAFLSSASRLSSSCIQAVYFSHPERVSSLGDGSTITASAASACTLCIDTHTAKARVEGFGILGKVFVREFIFISREYYKIYTMLQLDYVYQA
jgi:hypothetical protein